MSQAHRCGIDVGVLFFLESLEFQPLFIAVKNVLELESCIIVADFDRLHSDINFILGVIKKHYACMHSAL